MSESASAQASRRSEHRSLTQGRYGSVADFDALARNSRIIWGTIAAMAVATIVGFWATDLSLAWTSVGIILTSTVVCLIVSGFYHLFRPGSQSPTARNAPRSLCSFWRWVAPYLFRWGR